MHAGQASKKQEMIEQKKFIKIHGIYLMLTLTSDDYDYAYDKIFLKQKNLIKPEDASEWIFRNVYGNITPE